MTEAKVLILEIQASVCVCVFMYMCLHVGVCSRDCPVTGNSVPLLLSDKQQHIVRQLSRGEAGGGSVLLTPG